ncbi:MAG: GIY-YIG nuclease family protein [Gemmatimonadetes bacterium]|nr:GIY-YIG nuclease family protein [Gemmatimonadota bacterium]
MREKVFSIYIMSSWSGVLYVGVTSDLAKRVWQHKSKEMDGFTKKYNVTRLVYCEQTPDALAAIAREKQLKVWTRKKKIALIEAKNPQWEDLAERWFR